MRQRLTALILSLGLLLNACGTYLPAAPAAFCKARWYAEVDEDLLEQARADLARAQFRGCAKIVIDLLSPGGNVLMGFEIIREMQAARRAGLIIEIHGRTFVASMATTLLAAGSPGYRYIDFRALTLVHGISSSGTCTYLVANPTTDEDKAVNQLIHNMADLLSELTGRPVRTTLEWLRCGNTQTGPGQLMVDLGFADHLE